VHLDAARCTRPQRRTRKLASFLVVRSRCMIEDLGPVLEGG
jgi:hypothetical protein